MIKLEKMYKTKNDIIMSLKVQNMITASLNCFQHDNFRNSSDSHLKRNLWIIQKLTETIN